MSENMPPPPPQYRSKDPARVRLRPATMDEVLDLMGPLTADFIDQQVLNMILMNRGYDNIVGEDLLGCMQRAIDAHSPREGKIISTTECRFLLTAVDRWLDVTTEGKKRVHFYIGTSEVNTQFFTRDWPVFTDCVYNCDEDTLNDFQSYGQHIFAVGNNQFRHDTMRDVVRAQVDWLLERNCQVGNCGVILRHVQDFLGIQPCTTHLSEDDTQAAEAAVALQSLQRVRPVLIDIKKPATAGVCKHKATEQAHEAAAPAVMSQDTSADVEPAASVDVGLDGAVSDRTLRPAPYSALTKTDPEDLALTDNEEVQHNPEFSMPPPSLVAKDKKKRRKERKKNKKNKTSCGTENTNKVIEQPIAEAAEIEAKQNQEESDICMPPPSLPLEQDIKDADNTANVNNPAEVAETTQKQQQDCNSCMPAPVLPHNDDDVKHIKDTPKSTDLVVEVRQITDRPSDDSSKNLRTTPDNLESEAHEDEIAELGVAEQQQPTPAELEHTHDLRDYAEMERLHHVAFFMEDLRRDIGSYETLRADLESGPPLGLQMLEEALLRLEAQARRQTSRVF